MIRWDRLLGIIITILVIVSWMSPELTDLSGWFLVLALFFLL